MTDTVQMRIIEAAGPIFAQKGFVATTVREVCAAAKVNQAAINYYFGSKEGLYKEVFASTYSSFTPFLFAGEPDQSRPFEDRFYELIAQRTKNIFATELIAWKSQLIFRELHDPTPSCGEKLQEYIIQDYKVINRYLDEYFDPSTPEHIRWKSIFSIFGSIFFYKKCGWLLPKIVLEDIRQESFQPEQIAAFVVQTFFTTAAPYRKQPTKE
jgi:AcrR family transcriptional regulator